jgi:hypothetical protein
MNLVTLRITNIAIEGTPTKAKGPYEDVIEKINIDGNDRQSAYPPCTTWQVLY